MNNTGLSINFRDRRKLSLLQGSSSGPPGPPPKNAKADDIRREPQIDLNSLFGGQSVNNCSTRVEVVVFFVLFVALTVASFFFTIVLFVASTVASICAHCTMFFLAVHNSSIGDLVTHSVTESLTDSLLLLTL